MKDESENAGERMQCTVVLIAIMNDEGVKDSLQNTTN